LAESGENISAAPGAPFSPGGRRVGDEGGAAVEQSPQCMLKLSAPLIRPFGAPSPSRGEGEPLAELRVNTGAAAGAPFLRRLEALYLCSLHPSVVIVGLDPTIQKAAPMGAGATLASEDVGALCGSSGQARGRRGRDGREVQGGGGCRSWCCSWAALGVNSRSLSCAVNGGVRCPLALDPNRMR
jgi:hypothetical protein